MPPQDHQNDKLSLGPSDIGLGVFAKSPLRKREKCGYLSGETFLFEELMAQDDLGSNSIQIGPGLYVEPCFPLRFVNHSCEPNVGLSEDLVLIALRPISQGQEIRFDYSTTMFERYFTMDCECGTNLCRGTVQDFDLLPSHLRDRYLRLGIVQSFIRDRYTEASERSDDQLPVSLLGAIQNECGLSIGADRVPTFSYSY